MVERKYQYRLIELRKQRNESQEQVAEAADISRVALSRYENGTREPNVTTAIKLARHFEVSVERLFSDDPISDYKLDAAFMQPRLQLSSHECDMIRSYRSMPAAKQEAVCDILRIEHPSFAKVN